MQVPETSLKDVDISADLNHIEGSHADRLSLRIGSDRKSIKKTLEQNLHYNLIAIWGSNMMEIQDVSISSDKIS